MSIEKIYLSKQATVKNNPNGLFAHNKTGIDLHDYIVNIVNGGSSNAVITASNGLTINPANNVILGGTLIANTTIDGGSSADFEIVNIDNQLTFQSNGTITVEGDITQINGGDILIDSADFISIATPAVNASTASAGEVLTLINATTGECEYQPFVPSFNKGIIAQPTSDVTTVTVDRQAGRITMFPSTRLVGTAPWTFRILNSYVTDISIVLVTAGIGTLTTTVLANAITAPGYIDVTLSLEGGLDLVAESIILSFLVI